MREGPCSLEFFDGIQRIQKGASEPHIGWTGAVYALSLQSACGSMPPFGKFERREKAPRRRWTTWCENGLMLDMRHVGGPFGACRPRAPGAWLPVWRPPRAPRRRIGAP